MKIHQLLDNSKIILTNEENNFVEKYGDNIPIANLHDRDTVVAQNLTTKGVYDVKNNTLHFRRGFTQGSLLMNRARHGNDHLSDRM